MKFVEFQKHLSISLDLWPVSRDGTGRARGDVGRAKRFPFDIGGVWVKTFGVEARKVVCWVYTPIVDKCAFLALAISMITEGVAIARHLAICLQ